MINSTLEEICVNERGSIISGPFGSNISSKFFVESGIPVIRGNNLTISSEKFIDDGFVFITPEKAKELNCYAIKDDLIFTAAGTLGQVGIISGDLKYKEYVISNKQIRARIDNSKVDPLYAYYWFTSPWIQKILTSNNKGSTVPLLTLMEVKNLPISYPKSLREQRRIVSILDAINRKIQVNLQLNKKIDEYLKIIYQYWFLQFEFPDENGKPYKSFGGKFKMCDELNREIPIEWESIKLSDLMMKKSSPFDYKTIQKVIDLSVMPSSSLSVNDFNNSNMFSTNLFDLAEGDILFGSIRPYLKKACISPINGVVAGTVHNFNVIKNEYYNYCIETLTNDFFFDFAVTNSKGTKMPVIGYKEILNYEVPYNFEIVKKYNEIIDLKEIVIRNIQNNQELLKLEKFLYPLLMTGKIKF